MEGTVPMELHEIRYFLAVCRTRNFTRAAEQCHVTQPALTRAIQKMEEELGGLLFSRERGNVHLTELGRLMEPQFAEMIARAQEARQAAARFLRLEGAALSLGVLGTIGPMRFVRFLRAFRDRHPGIDITLIEDTPARLMERLTSGEIDLAVMARPDGFPEPLRAQPLYDERFFIACGPEHDFARRDAVRLAELDGQTYLQRVNCEYREYLRELLAANGVEILRSYRSERDDWVQSMAAAGLGICFLPEFCALLPGLVLRPVIDPEVRREICVVTVAGRRWSSPVAAIVQAIRGFDWSAVGPSDSAARSIGGGLAAARGVTSA
jgi:DNA-binding transcriptional LysR family regulator